MCSTELCPIIKNVCEIINSFFRFHLGSHTVSFKSLLISSTVTTCTMPCTVPVSQRFVNSFLTKFLITSTSAFSFSATAFSRASRRFLLDIVKASSSASWCYCAETRCRQLSYLCLKTSAVSLLRK